MPEYTCPVCGKKTTREDMARTYDCHGIPFRLVCLDCHEEIMNGRGFDGQEYDEFDENF